MAEIRVNVSNHQSLFDVDVQRIVDAVRRILVTHGFSSGEVCVAVVDDSQIHMLNLRHLNHDYPTDVLSFLYEASDSSIDGELIVSSDTARRVGSEHGLREHDELLLYVIHGALHLVGLDDDTEDAQAEMREHERRYLQAFGIDLPAEPMTKGGYEWQGDTDSKFGSGGHS